MFRNYITIALRHLRKNKVYTFINLSGLSVGITCCALIYLFVSHELSFDKGFENGKDIYRLIREFKSGDDSGTTPATAGPYGPTLRMDFPDDVINMTRIFPNNGLISVEDRHIQEEKIMFADSNFLQMFDFELISGQANEVMSQPNQAVLTEAAALKYFGNTDPIGKAFSVDDRFNFIVSGVVRKSINSTFDFEVLLPLAVYRDRGWFTNWRSNGFYTYIQLGSASDPRDMESKFIGFMDKQFGKDFEQGSYVQVLQLQPLNDVYLNNSHEYDFVPHGSRNLVYSSIGIAIFILFIACINFINLSTAKYTNRLGEVGIRKVLGAYKNSLRVQFLVESIILALLALVISIAMLEAILPFFNDFAGKQLSINYLNPEMILVFGSLVLVTGFVAGFYPAFFLSSFQPVKIFRGNKSSRSYNANLRKTLVVIQFAISIMLIVGTAIINQQMSFIQNKDLGFDKDQVVILNLNNREIYENWEVFKQTLEANASVKAVTLTSGEPGGFHDQFIREIKSQDNLPLPFRTVFADFDYVTTFDLEIVAGRDFDKSLMTDSTNSVIINETAAKRSGWTPTEAIGQIIAEPAIAGFNEVRLEKKVIGVVGDYHALSMREEIEPIIISNRDIQIGYAGIKLAGGDIRSSINMIENAWGQSVTRHRIDWNFLDDKLNKLYAAEIKQHDLFIVFSFLAIFIGCLGLYGLVSYAAEQRTREIGIRKVHGASIANIIYLLSKDFSKLVLIAFVLAVPVSYYAMQQWLNDFAYQISIGWEVFALAGLAAIVISWITVSYESYKAASTNPVEALRYE
ncbi:MAG: FtsX-like permease family protein [Cyclobacteriaceae bacterium]